MAVEIIRISEEEASKLKPATKTPKTTTKHVRSDEKGNLTQVR